MVMKNEESGQYASPPCFMHELAPEFERTGNDVQTSLDVTRWRKAERQRLIGERLAMSADQRLACSKKIAERAGRVIGEIGGKVVSFYWPFRGEPDLREWMVNVLVGAGRVALPVVVEKGKPLEFRLWAPGEPLERGVWDILVPSRGSAVLPDVVIAPVVGFDSENYRLGYGGGFFDRTLAAALKKPIVVGVGYAQSRITSIYPQPHDIAMDVIVTDE